jgi:two-component system NtrC family sensor kinase
MRAELQDIMRRVSMSPLIDGGEEEAAIRQVLASACEGLGVQRAGVWYLDADRMAIRCRLLIDQTNGSESGDMVLAQSDFPAYFAALARERAITAHDAHADPSTSEFSAGYLGPLGIGALLDVPIRHHGQMIGVICCEHCGGPRTWSADEVSFAGGLGDLVGRAINARAQRELQGELSALNRDLEDRVARRTAELNSMQSQLLSAEKMAALGGLVAGVAHEINTPLGVAVTAVSLLGESRTALMQRFQAGTLDEGAFLEAMQEQERALQLLEWNLSRAATLVSSFKQTAVDQSSDVRQHFQLRPLLERTLLSLHPVTRSVCDPVALHCPEALWMDGYAGALIQVLTNLVTNAVRHAFAQARADAFIGVRVSELAADRVRIEVSDNGVGIEPALQPRVFEPLFTTRRGQGGSGLGLSIAYNWWCNDGAVRCRWRACPGRAPVSAPICRCGHGARSLGGRKFVGCNARETGTTRHHLLRPGAHPGLVGATRRYSVFARFASTPSAAHAPSAASRTVRARRPARWPAGAWRVVAARSARPTRPARPATNCLRASRPVPTSSRGAATVHAVRAGRCGSDGVRVRAR